jgi:hypothetical protein
MTLSQKMEIYFQDFSFMPLFVQVRRAALVQRGILLTPSRVCPCQENYLKHTFARAQGLVGRERTLKELQLMEQAADSISEGDVMDRMIHGCVTPSLLARTSTRACFLALTLVPPPPCVAVPTSSGASFRITPSCRPSGRPTSATARAPTAREATVRASPRECLRLTCRCRACS